MECICRQRGIVVCCFSLLSSLFPAVIFWGARPKREGFRGEGRFFPLFFRAITAITADGAGAERPTHDDPAVQPPATDLRHSRESGNLASARASGLSSIPSRGMT